MTYKELIDLGFEREDYHDGVVFNITGHHPYHLTLLLSERIAHNSDSDKSVEITACFNADMKCVEVIRCDIESNIMGRLIFTDIEELKDLIKFFGKDCSRSVNGKDK